MILARGLVEHKEYNDWVKVCGDLVIKGIKGKYM